MVTIEFSSISQLNLHKPENLLVSLSFGSGDSSKSINESLALPSR